MSDDECKICGAGEILPSGICDHCDSKADWHPLSPRPIATAPKDGALLLLFSEGWVIGGWEDHLAKWTSLEEDAWLAPTHWLPLPPNP